MQEFVKARGLCFRVVQWGQGPNPMLLLHGVHGTVALGPGDVLFSRRRPRTRACTSPAARCSPR